MMTIKRKIDEIYLDSDNETNADSLNTISELNMHFSKKLCIEDTSIQNNIYQKEYSKNYFLEILKQHIIESLMIIQNDMGSKEFLNHVYNRYINILDKLEINNTDVTIEIIRFFTLYNKWLDYLKIADLSTSREIMCNMFSIILNIDNYFLNYYLT